MVQMGSDCQSHSTMELMKTTSSFFAKIRQKLFNWRLEWEIYNQIFSHLNREKQHDYPFESREELLEVVIRGNHRITHEIAAIEQQAGRMGKAYGEAFRYVMYRDLTSRMEL